MRTRLDQAAAAFARREAEQLPHLADRARFAELLPTPRCCRNGDASGLRRQSAPIIWMVGLVPSPGSTRRRRCHTLN